MRRFGSLRAALAAVGVGAALLVAAGTLGEVHGAFDSLAEFRAHLSAVALAAGAATLALRPRLASAATVAALVAVVAGAVGGASVLPYVVPRNAVAAAPDAPVYTLLQMNLRFDADIAPALSLVRTLRPDIVTVQEVDPRMEDDLRALDGYAASLCQRRGSLTESLVLSRHPFLDDPCATRHTTARRIDLDGTAVTVLSQHLLWPWPFGQSASVARLAPALRLLSGPVIVGGDFNGAPWSAAVRRFARESGTTPVAGIGFTWPHYTLPHALTPWVGLPLDNVLMSREVQPLEARRAAPTASDHVPVIVRFALAPRAGDPERPVAALASPRVSAAARSLR